MATTTTPDARGALRALAAVASVALLSACGGSGSTGTPPITLKGATFWAPASDLTQAAIRNVEGGSGANFGSVIYIDDGLAEFLQAQTQSSADGTLFFQVDANNFAIVGTPDGASPSQYSDMRFLRLVYSSGGEIYVQDGVLGRFTSDANMALASGQATYTGQSTAEVLARPRSGSNFDLLQGDTVATVDFDAKTVEILLSNFRPSPDATFDAVRVSGMTISGNRFGGGTFTALAGGTPTGDFSGGDFQSSGVFAGWNDSNGTAAGGDTPAELGGAFLASTTDGIAAGRYVAD